MMVTIKVTMTITGTCFTGYIPLRSKFRLHLDGVRSLGTSGVSSLNCWCLIDQNFGFRQDGD